MQDQEIQVGKENANINKEQVFWMKDYSLIIYRSNETETFM